MIIDRNNVTLGSILQAVDLQNKKVLEIGCGDGRISKGLVGRTKTLVALDFDQESVTKARKSVTGGYVLNGSGECLPFVDACFEVILFTLSLHHQQSANALREALRVLTNDGLVLVIEPVADGEIEQLCHLFDDETVVLNEARQAMEQSDFIIAHEEVIYPEWQANTAQELRWLFNHYDVPQDPEKIVEINNFLGQKVSINPLILHDKLSVCWLQKRNKGS
jgi:ubiquinone/menaquinone biosynthesis C-methylase UbiE